MAAVAYVRPSTPIGFHQPTGSELLHWHERLILDAKSERTQVCLCAFIGILLNLLAILAAALVLELSVILRTTAFEVSLPFTYACAFGALIVGLMLLLAILTKPSGRAERAREMLDCSGDVSTGRPEAFALVLIMALALYGSFCLVETARRIFIRWRLRRVDPSELCRLIACISAAPAGISIAFLRKQGQSEKSLRAALATLILYDWIKLAGRDVVIQQSGSMRACLRRHPLADIFNPGL